MKVKQAATFFNKMVKEGRGNFPVQLMVVDQGITFAQDVRFELAREYDGERIWIYEAGLQQPPEWMYRK